jgi:hypothetical protein
LYLGRIGNVFHTKDIDTAIKKGRKYDPDIINQYALKSMGIDDAAAKSAIALGGRLIIHTANSYRK